MSLPRYLILDVDDTLTRHGRIPPDALAALQRATDRGVSVILNTGRSAGWGAALQAYLPGVAAVVVENGGAWWDPAVTPVASGREVPVQLLRPQPPEGRAGLFAVRQQAGRALGLELLPTADDPFRLTDHTVVRAVPTGEAGAATLLALRRYVSEQSEGQVEILASSVHIHFYADGPTPRSKAAGVAALLARRGIADPDAELRRHAVAVGDSGNDASLFSPGRFALSVGVRNIEPYLAELGACVPTHITSAAEADGLVELIDELLAGRHPLP